MSRKKEHKQHPSILKNPPNVKQAGDFDKWKSYGALAVIVLISVIAYLPVLHNSLLAWDDDVYIKNNPLIYSIDLKAIFSNNVMGNWHPLTILTLAVEHHLFGLNATGYHSVNLFLHLLNVILVFYTVFLLSDKVVVGLVAALLFGIHPLHVESVAWAAELKDLLYTLFFLASYIFYLKYLKERKKEAGAVAVAAAATATATKTNRQYKFYYLALILFTFSLLSKAMAASLPLVLILTDYFKGRKINKKTLLEKAPFFLLAIVFGVVAFLAQKSSGATQLMTIFTIPQRLVFASYGFMTYLFKLLFPLNLSAFYPYPLNNDIPVQYYAYVFLFLGLAGYLFYWHRFSKKILFGVGFFVLTIFLVLQLLPVGKTIMADRYSYIPSIGIFYLAGEGIVLLWSKKLKLMAIVLLSVFTVFFSVRTYARCGVWKNDRSLWNDVIGQDKTIEDAYYNRGLVFMEEKNNDEAIKDFNKAIELKPDFANPYNNLGIVLTNAKRNEEAVKNFNKAIELKPDFSDAYNNRGFIFMNGKRNNEAINDFNNAIKLNPGNAEAYFNRGTLFIIEKRNDAAINDFNKAIELKPGYAEAYNSRGSFFVNVKRNEEAVQDFNKAIELKPDNAQSYYNRGVLFFNEKRNDEAMHDFSKAIGLKPDYAIAFNNRGVVFINENRNEEAINDFNKAIELKPDLADAYNNRGSVFAGEKRNNEAINDFNKATELRPDYLSAYNSKATLCFEEKRYEEAIGAYTRVIALKPDYAQAYYKRGLAEYNSGKKVAACIDLKQAAALSYKPAEDVLSRICK